MFEVESLEIFFYTAPVDMRRSIDGLSIIVSEHLNLEPNRGALYVFFNKSKDKLKILYWQRGGFCLWYKRLEKERFKIPQSTGVLTLTFQQLRWLLDGLDYTKLQGHKSLSYTAFY
jgi:transposase